jgi:hypothetical protein
LTPDQPLTVDVGEAPWATPNQAAFSVDGGRTWQHTPAGVREGKRIRYELRCAGTSARVAWGPPFLPADASRLVQRIAKQSPCAEAFSLCRTRGGHETPAVRITADGARQPRPLIWIQARQHAWETGSSWIAKGFAEWVVSDLPEAEQLRETCEIVVVPIMDIDNVQLGAGGKNQQPQDHNRDWTDHPHWHAVAAAQVHLRSAAEAGRLAAFIDLHNPGANERFPFFYVSAEELQSDAARANHAEFLVAARAEITGPLGFQGKTLVSGKAYDPRAWMAISKNWVAQLGTPAVAVTLETPWNTPHSTVAGYMTVGRQLGKTLARYIQAPATAP